MARASILLGFDEIDVVPQSNLGLGIKKLGAYDERIGVEIDRQSKIEKNPAHMGWGYHPRSFQLKRTEQVNNYLKAHPEVTRRQAREKTK